MSRHYLDYASTSPLRPVAHQAMLQALEFAAADPSRIYTEALTTRQLLEFGRQSVADYCRARPREVVFVSSATEGLVSAIWSISHTVENPTIITSAVEHSAVTQAAARSGQVTTMSVDSTGLFDPDDVGRAIDAVRADGGTVALFACQWVNHEVGMVQPLERAIAAAKERQVPVLVDAAQGVGRLPFDFSSLGADVVVFSGHKVGGPAGTGVVLVRQGFRTPPFLVGGAQERLRRAGLENVVGAVGLGAACAELADTETEERNRSSVWSETVRECLSALDGVTLHGPSSPEHQAPHIVSASIADIEPQAILLSLDQAGVSVHSGSACAAEDIEPSPVLQAMGVDADRSLRVSTGWATTDADVDAFCDAAPAAITKLRALRG